MRLHWFLCASPLSVVFLLSLSSLPYLITFSLPLYSQLFLLLLPLAAVATYWSSTLRNTHTHIFLPANLPVSKLRQSRVPETPGPKGKGYPLPIRPRPLPRVRGCRPHRTQLRRSTAVGVASPPLLLHAVGWRNCALVSTVVQGEKCDAMGLHNKYMQA